MASSKKTSQKVGTPPFETEELRKQLSAFYNREIDNPLTGQKIKIGSCKWGVYLFLDYDNEPIYVGQTNESLRSRIGRHLTNQRTDAVAMSVLDPFEVKTIRVWPLLHYQKTSSKDQEAKRHLNALECLIYKSSVAESQFKAILNEKNPPQETLKVVAPVHYEGSIVSNAVLSLREHPDTRLARRAQILSRLSQVIAERQVQGGLRRVLTVQAERLRWLAQKRYDELGGAGSVEAEDEINDSDEF